MIRFEIVYAQVWMHLQQTFSVSILLASNLHCVHKASSSLKIFNFSSIDDETRRKFFFCFFPIWLFLLNGLQQTCLSRELGISVLILNRWILEEHSQKSKTAVTAFTSKHNYGQSKLVRIFWIRPIERTPWKLLINAKNRKSIFAALGPFPHDKSYIIKFFLHLKI